MNNNRRRSDILFAMLLALSAHIAFGVGVGIVVSMQERSPRPVFRTGLSTVELGFAPAPVPEEPEPQPELVREKEPEPEPDDIVLKHDEPEKEVSDDKEKPVPAPDADLRDKGVRTIDLGQTDINPIYPLGARMRGEEGSVTLRIHIGSDGRATDIDIIESSRFVSIDRSAVDAVKQVSFEGGAGDGNEVVELTIKYELLD